ncbi:MAG: hypothetical protein L0221_04375 [Chloroflexi bacterium]|nr:hypothetical protein [Chloroflexota bacterium]
MPSQQIAENLAFINWTILSGLAIGSYAAVVLGQFRTSATKGYLGFVAFTAAVFGALAWLVDGALPLRWYVGNVLPVLTESPWNEPRRIALALFALIALVNAVAIVWGARAWTLAAGGLASGIAALAFGALSWGDHPLGWTLLLVQLLVLAGATGGVWAAMILGHWYLVTPKLPEAPLILFSRLLVGAVALQIVLFVAWLAVGAGPEGSPMFGELTGSAALFVWLRFGVGLVFPLILSWAALQTARTRSMESATGLLYINTGAIAVGTILAAGLYFGAGILA